MGTSRWIHWFHRHWRAIDRASLAMLAAYALRWALEANPDSDGFAYWNAWHAGLYVGHWPVAGAYIYSPAFAQVVLWPLAQLPFELYRVILVCAQVFAITAVLRAPLALAVLVLPWWPYASYPNPVGGSLISGNIDVTLGAIVAVGLRWPAAWAFAFLTKVTPGVGVLWFAVRREWRQLAVAIGTTAAISCVSFAITPGLWFDWVAALRSSGDPASLAVLIPWPLAVRLPLCAALIAIGARRGWRWTVAVGAGLALPQLGYGSYAVVVIAGLAVREGLDDLRHRHGGENPIGPVADPQGPAAVLDDLEDEGIRA